MKLLFPIILVFLLFSCQKPTTEPEINQTDHCKNIDESIKRVILGEWFVDTFIIEVYYENDPNHLKGWSLEESSPWGKLIFDENCQILNSQPNPPIFAGTYTDLTDSIFVLDIVFEKKDTATITKLTQNNFTFRFISHPFDTIPLLINEYTYIMSR